ncbi:hypothetical protein LCGC14_1293880, partial [marine sediment metagenome]
MNSVFIDKKYTKWDNDNYDDLYFALSENPPDTFKTEDISHIVAEVPG